jgi:hypothetical protein
LQDIAHGATFSRGVATPYFEIYLIAELIASLEVPAKTFAFPSLTFQNRRKTDQQNTLSGFITLI